MAGTGYGQGPLTGSAIETRTMVEDAIGILMERKHLDRDGALEVLLLAASEAELQLGRAAAQVVNEAEHPAPERDVLVVTQGAGQGEISLDETAVAHHH